MCFDMYFERTALFMIVHVLRLLFSIYRCGNNFKLTFAADIVTFGLASHVSFTIIIGPLVKFPELVASVRV